MKEEAESLAEQRKHQRQIQEQERLDEAERRKEEREEARLVRSEKRDWDRKRREEARKAIENAANLKATSLAVSRRPRLKTSSLNVSMACLSRLKSRTSIRRRPRDPARRSLIHLASSIVSVM